jgi:hypothetical protein
MAAIGLPRLGASPREGVKVGDVVAVEVAGAGSLPVPEALLTWLTRLAVLARLTGIRLPDAVGRLGLLRVA